VPDVHHEEQYEQEQMPVPVHEQPVYEQAPLHIPAFEPQAAPPPPPAPPAAAQEMAAERSSYEHAPEEQESTLAYLNEPPQPAPTVSHEPTFSVPEPAPIYITKENPVNEELYAKYNMAQAEIEQLKSQVASLTATQELRRRTRKISDVGSNGGSDVMTVIEDAPIQQDGVPLQVVVVIALGVFITTYLFF
jgi:vesicle-associated membrane protein-associated protein A